jgi:hypothetical protein
LIRIRFLTGSVVVTAFTSRTAEYRAIEAYRPAGIDGPRSCLLADRAALRIDQLYPVSGFLAETPAYGSYLWPQAVRVDPTCRTRYFATDCYSIRQLDGATVRPVAGAAKNGDGVAIFQGILGCLVAADGRRLYVTDANNHRICAVDIESGQIRPIAGNGQAKNIDGIGIQSSISFPKKLVFDRRYKDESVLFITASDALRRFDVKTGELTTVLFDRPINPYAIASTASGLLVFSCHLTYCLYAADSKTRQLERLAGGTWRFDRMTADGDALFDATFGAVFDICVDDDAQCIWTVESELVRYVTAPPHLFWPPSNDDS